MDIIITKNDKGQAICEMKYNANQNWIHVTWKGYANLEAIKSWGESYIRMMEETGCPYLLNDDSRSSGSWTDALEWIESYLLPIAIEKGVRYFAHVLSKDEYAILSSRELNRRIADILEIGSFKNVIDAKMWLIDIQEKDIRSS